VAFSLNAPQPPPLDHLRELEVSHGNFYSEVRELAALTTVQLEAAALVAPQATLPSSAAHAAAPIPAFSRKAHELLHVPSKAQQAAVTPGAPASGAPLPSSGASAAPPAASPAPAPAASADKQSNKGSLKAT
jgi:hypothetical protein